MAHDVYISYSANDKPIADAICAHIEAAGIRCWIAPRDIIAGEDKPATITRAISQSRVLVLVFSVYSNASDDISRELFLAADHKLVIIPFKIDDIEPEPGKRYYLARTHWLDAINPPTQEQIQVLVERVCKLVSARREEKAKIQPPTPSPRPDGTASTVPIQPVRGRRPSPWLWLIPVGILLLILLGWSALFSTLHAASPQSTQAASQVFSSSEVPSVPPTLFAASAIPTAVQTPDLIRTYILEPFNENSLRWPVEESSGPDWQGSLTITNNILDWNGTSLVRMNALVHPALASLQQDLTDQEVSTRINILSNDMKGVYGLYFRAAADENRFYAFITLENMQDRTFGFYVVTDGNHWKNLIDYQISPAASGPGWVKMTARVTGSHIQLLVNDQKLTEFDDDTLSSGLSGLLVTAYAPGKAINVQFDDFTILLPSP